MKIQNIQNNNQKQVKFEKLHRIKCEGLTPEIIKTLADDLLEISDKFKVRIDKPFLSKAGHCYVDADDKADGYIMFAIMHFKNKMGNLIGSDFKAEYKGIKLPKELFNDIDSYY